MPTKLFEGDQITTDEPLANDRFALAQSSEVGARWYTWTKLKAYINSAFSTVADYLDFTPQSSAPSYSEGRLYYDDVKKAMTYFNDSSEVAVNLGQEVLFIVENQTGGLLANGTVIAPNESTVITKADAYYKDRSRLIAVLTEDIADGETGYATKLGQVGSLDTSAFSAGQVIYLGTDGAFSATTPTDGGYACIIGVVDVSHATEGIITVDTAISDLTVEVTDTNGFPPDQKSDTQLSKVDATRTFTIGPDGPPDFHFYELGDKYEKTGSESVVWSDVEGEHWFYYDSGVLTTLANPTGSQKEHIILNHAFIAFIYWNATDNEAVIDIFEERHGIAMSPQTHLYLHLTRGAQYVSGLAVGGVIANGNGSLDTHAQFSVSAGVFFDEDLQNSPSAISVGDTVNVAYNSGATALMRSDTQTNFGVLNAPAGRLYFNEWTGATWQLTEVSNGDFVLYHVFAINGVTVGTVSVVGQNEYGTVSSARAGASAEISNLLSQLPFAEMIPLATIIYQTRDNYSNAVKARIRSTDTGEDFIDWRTSEISQGTPASSHANLTDLEVSDTGNTWGHVDNSAPLQIPELTTTERDAIVTPNDGVVIFNTTTSQLEIYDASAWSSITSPSALNEPLETTFWQSSLNKVEDNILELDINIGLRLFVPTKCTGTIDEVKIWVEDLGSGTNTLTINVTNAGSNLFASDKTITTVGWHTWTPDQNTTAAIGNEIGLEVVIGKGVDDISNGKLQVNILRS